MPRHTLKPHTPAPLTAACDLTLPTQTIISRTVPRSWPTPGPDAVHKRPAIFVLYAGSKDISTDVLGYIDW